MNLKALYDSLPPSYHDDTPACIIVGAGDSPLAFPLAALRRLPSPAEKGDHEVVDEENVLAQSHDGNPSVTCGATSLCTREAYRAKQADEERVLAHSDDDNPSVTCGATPLCTREAYRAKQADEESFPVQNSPRRDLIIAADGGYRYLKEMGIRCDLLMGDLDSLSPDVALNAEVMRFAPEKDDTDTMLAVKHALSLGYTKFILLGMFGGRFDHTVGTLQTVAYLTRRGARVFAFEASQNDKNASFITGVCNGTLDFPKEAVGYLSLIPWGGKAHGVTLEGLKYPLADATLLPDLTLGISNEFTGVPARVTVKDGLLLAVKSI